MKTKPLTRAQVKRIISSSDPVSLLEEYHSKGFWIEDFLLDVLNGLVVCPKCLVFEDVVYGKVRLKAISLSHTTFFFVKQKDGSYMLWP